jgi:Leucine-rich repeat (LRR) protein
MPHAWVRYVVQEAGLKGIAMAGATAGNNYLSGQKTPVAVLCCAEIIYNVTNFPTIPTSSQTYHDVWSAIASGARGISVFAYWHALHDDPSLVTNLQQLNLAASQISGPEKIGDVVLYGIPNTNVTFTVTAGPLQTVAFQPPSESSLIQYPSLNVLSLSWSTNVYVIAVNSTDRIVSAILTNLPWSAASATLPFEFREVNVTEGSFIDTFAPWGVHIYKLPGYAVFDPNLDAAIASLWGKSAGNLTLSDLTNLTFLPANNLQIRSLTGLGAATNLVSLYLNRNAIQDLTPLTNVIQLRSLQIEQNQVSDLGPLAGLTNLSSLSIGANPITNYWVLSNCTALANLSVKGGTFTDLTVLKDLTNLQSLVLWNDHITDAAPVAGLTRLTNLDLSGNGLSNLFFLTNLTSLSAVELDNNQIVDGSPLGQLSGLKSVSLSGNLLKNINFVTNLTRLRLLNLASNLITDLSPLTGMIQLSELLPHHREVANIIPPIQIPLSLVVNISFNELDLGLNSPATAVIGSLAGAGAAVRYAPQFPLDSDGDGMPDSWEIAHGLNPQDPSDAAIDSDADGLSNLLEYALGTDPMNPADGQAAMGSSFVADDDGKHLTLSFKRRNTPVRLEYVPEVSADKVNWYADSAHVQLVSSTNVDDQFDSVAMKDATPVTIFAPRFFRLRIVHY